MAEKPELPKKKWSIEIEPVGEFEEFRPFPHMVASKAMEVNYFTYKLMWGDECVLDCKMFVPIEMMVSSDGKTVVDFGKFLEEAQK
jgi:hypothetical protein